MTEPESSARDPLAPTIDPLASLDLAADTPPTTEPRPDLAEAPPESLQPPSPEQVRQLAKMAKMLADLIGNYHTLFKSFESQGGHTLPAPIKLGMSLEDVIIKQVRESADSIISRLQD